MKSRVIIENAAGTSFISKVNRVAVPALAAAKPLSLVVLTSKGDSVMGIGGVGARGPTGCGAGAVWEKRKTGTNIGSARKRRRIAMARARSGAEVIG